MVLVGRRKVWALVLATSALFLTMVGLVPANAASSRCGRHAWCDRSLAPSARAALLLAGLTTAEKIGLLTGQAVPRLDVPAVRFTDGAVGAGGIRAGFEPATGLPAAIALAAGFDRTSAQEYGSVVGNETKNRGYDGVWGPTVNIMRTPLGGRTFEAYGEDPYLSGETAAAWIVGAQHQGVMADAKHLVGNDQEGYLGVPLVGVVGTRYVGDSVIDDRSLHEIELAPFAAAVQEGDTASVMCAYNRVNGVFSCANAKLLQQDLRREIGFSGFVMSDGGAAHETAADLNAGMNFDIIGSSYAPPLVEAALATGQVTMATLDARVRELLDTLFAYGFFDRPTYADRTAAIDHPAHATVAEAAAEQGATLLRNDGTLPLAPSRLHRIAVIGWAATHYVRGSGSSEVTPFSTDTALQAIKQRIGPGVDVTYDDGTDPLAAANDAAHADVALVFANDTESEGVDKLCMSLDCPGVGLPNFANLGDPQLNVGPQDELISTVARANRRTVVVLETGAPVLTPWRDEVAGLLEAWYPGQQGGTAITHVLFGDVDPGGRLPVTFPRQASDTPTSGDLQAYPGVPETVVYREGVLVGYRWYDTKQIAPAFPFGFGLSYTSFRYDDFRVQGTAGTPGASVTVRITNTGARRGTAVPEVYAGIARPDASTVEPPWQLVGYDSVSLAPGQSAAIHIDVDARHLAYWDTGRAGWRVAPGCDRLAIGTSSRAILDSATVTVGNASCPGSSTSTPAQ